VNEPRDPVTDPAPDGIDEGRRLIRLGGDKGLSLADRLAERFHRLTWRTPLHTLRLKGRYPLKLIAVPDDPILGDIPRGTMLLEGVLSFRGEARDIETLDLAKPLPKPFAEYLHSFAWLRDLSTVATRARGAPIAEYLMGLWLTAHADTQGGIAWRPDMWGRRILAWTAHAPLILSSSDQIYRSKVLNALAKGALHLDRTADKAPAGAPRIAAWCGVVAAGLLIPGGEPRQAFGEAGLLRALGTGLFDDGGSVSRSPAMLLDSIQLLTLLQESYVARGLELPEMVAVTLTRMVAALLGVAHADRGLSSWQGGGPASETQVAAVIEASGVRTRPLRQARDWGYQRLAAGTAVLIVDAAPPPIARLVEGGCASTLAFEFSDGPARIVVNCGGALHADDRRQQLDRDPRRRYARPRRRRSRTEPPGIGCRQPDRGEPRRLCPPLGLPPPPPADAHRRRPRTPRRGRAVAARPQAPGGVVVVRDPLPPGGGRAGIPHGGRPRRDPPPPRWRALAIPLPRWRTGG
jgi:uncharacterized heparinase superfamily protein